MVAQRARRKDAAAGDGLSVAALGADDAAVVCVLAPRVAAAATVNTMRTRWRRRWWIVRAARGCGAAMGPVTFV